jgi:F-type H+-transporting ATPase subunit alpha
MTQLRAAELTKETEKRLKHGQAVTELLIQPKNQPVPLEVQAMYLYALNKGVLDYLSIEELKRFKQDFPAYVLNWDPDLSAEIRRTRDLSKENKKRLDECLKRYVQKLKV